MSCSWYRCSAPTPEKEEYCTLHKKAMGIEKPKKEPKPIAKQSEKKKEQIKSEKPKRDALSKFFAEMAAIMPTNCEECNKSLKPSLLIHERSTTCHVLPKRHFPTLATDKRNIIFLCIDCHSTMDNFSPTQMKIFEKAKGIVQQLLPDIPQENLKSIPDYYLTAP